MKVDDEIETLRVIMRSGNEFANCILEKTTIVSRSNFALWCLFETKKIETKRPSYAWHEQAAAICDKKKQLPQQLEFAIVSKELNRVRSGANEEG